eukprot:2510798-Rhodomonas_salina.2
MSAQGNSKAQASQQEQTFGDTKWHNLSVEEVMALQSVTENGLTDAEAAQRLEKFGTNELTPPPKPGFLMKLFQQVNNILIYSKTVLDLNQCACVSSAVA